ncbi:MAG TPA: response regulator transcription factor [Ferruginibacter sp.]|nr:response regulator transcription factor [Ferruginibacter sp.]HPH89601.1 response regulator transcription factor [Ferruginibacter sp.]
MANIVLTDDHILLRNGLAGLIKNLGHHVLFEADNGKDLIEKLNSRHLPDLVLMDINMPEMDGCEATEWLRKHHPKIKVLALSMYNNESAIIRMLKAGAKGYILKDSRPQQLEVAIDAIMKQGFHYSELLNGKLIHAINQMGDISTDLNTLVHLHEKETEFLKLCCTEFTYKEIAARLSVSPRTVDGYRDALFEKLNVKTRIGLVMFSVKNGIVQF